jgi:nicotinic acid phosphoribosyltransferase
MILRERSILDNDSYKFTMMWAVMQHFPEAKVRYEFVNRRKGQDFTGVIEILRKRITRFVKLNCLELNENSSKRSVHFYLIYSLTS